MNTSLCIKFNQGTHSYATSDGKVAGLILNLDLRIGYLQANSKSLRFTTQQHIIAKIDKTMMVSDRPTKLKSSFNTSNAFEGLTRMKKMSTP